MKRKFTPEERRNVEEAQRLRRDGQQLFGDWFRVQPTQPDLPLLVADRALEPLKTDQPSESGRCKFCGELHRQDDACPACESPEPDEAEFCHDCESVHLPNDHASHFHGADTRYQWLGIDCTHNRICRMNYAGNPSGCWEPPTTVQ